MGALNCPGDPGCPGNPAVDFSMGSQACNCQPDGTCVETGNSCSYTGPMTPAQSAAQASTLTGWLNANATYVALAAAAFLGLSMMRGR
jgi:hypothetical protein